jgi:hypothetical protein
VALQGWLLIDARFARRGTLDTANDVLSGYIAGRRVEAVGHLDHGLLVHRNLREGKKMTRSWSDGTHDDFTRAVSLALETAQAATLGARIADLRLQNEWLRLQILCPWRVENYLPPRRGTRATRYEAAA